MAILSTTRPAATDIAEVTDTPSTPADRRVTTRRGSISWVQAVKERRRHRGELARTIAAYPATRSAAAYVLPPARPAHLRGTLPRD